MKFHVISTRIVTFEVEAENEDEAMALHFDDQSTEIGSETLKLECERAS